FFSGIACAYFWNALGLSFVARNDNIGDVSWVFFNYRWCGDDQSIEQRL
ncbi:uncharacterized protein METZ01_LOCUS50181, partial [marine metagenome]